MRRTVPLLVLLLLGSLLGTTPAAAQERETTVDLDLSRSEVVAGGHSFGDAGAYEKLVGTIAFRVDPEDPRNAVVTDLDRAPRDADGLVAYDTDFYLLVPQDRSRWNGKLFFEVNNRGNKRTLAYVNSSVASQDRLSDPSTVADLGTGFLLEQGYAVAWAGWEGDVLPGNNRMTIRLPVPTEADGSPITGETVVEFHETDFAADGSTECLPLSGSADFASYPAVTDRPAELRVRPSDSPRPSGPEIPQGDTVPADAWRFEGDETVCVDGGFRPGTVYELGYTARDPRVMGLGYAATRDVVSFLRHRTADADGDANPLAAGGGVTHVLGQGISSSGMYLRDFVYQGFNEDTEGRAVFDGVNIHIPGAHKLFLNYRFAQPNPFSTQHRDRYIPHVGFPFHYGVRQDPVSGRTDGILKRPATDPLVVHTDSSTEYWQFQASLVNTDGFGSDVALPDTVRQYLVSGSQHFAAAGAVPSPGTCQQPSNPTHVGPALRALLVSLDRWVVDGTEPPSSRAPSIADGTLVASDRDATGFPEIPGVGYTGLYNAAAERDFGPQVEGNAGVIDDWRHADVVAPYDVRMPSVDAVGIDEGGLELPEVAAPTATLTGWNLQAEPYTVGDVCGLTGMRVPLARTPADAADGDERPTLQELYGTSEGYVQAVRAAADALVADRLLLPADARAAVQAAYAADVLPGTPTGGAVRVLHAAPGTGAVDVWVDGERVVEAATFGTLGAHTPVGPGDHRVEVRAAPSSAADAALVAGTVSAAGPTTVTVTGSAAGDGAPPALSVLADATAPEAPSAGLRVAHAVPDLGAVDVQLRPTPDGEWTTAATGVAPGADSGPLRVAAGTHDLRLLAAGTDEVVAVVADVVTPAGSVQTAHAIGSAGPGRDRPGLRVLVVPDGPGTDSATRLADQTPVVDTDETREDPVPHRYVHGTIGDAAYQLALPVEWNGRLLTSSRGFSGDEFSNDDTYKDVALRHGYAYAASDEGWNRRTIADQPEDSYHESRRRLAELTQHATGVVAAHHGRAPERSLLAGGSNGGHHTKWLVESFPELYDGGVSMYGYNSGLEMWRAFPVFLRNYDVIEPRIGDVIAAGGSDVDPPLTPEQTDALAAIYSIPAQLRGGFSYDVGRAPGSEREWPEAYVAAVGYLSDSIGEWDPTYDPDGDGTVSLDELEAWEPYEAPAEAQAEMRLLDLTGDLDRPVVVGHGTADTIVTPREADAYEQLVASVAGDDAPLRTYLFPEMGHGGAAVHPFVEQALAAVEDWITHRATDGAQGSEPGRITGLEPVAAG
ncbi:alpha/beta hydrolase domain-containing protein [Geodermatophilus sp. DSM 44513]|uniref:alpha/beta hydrolase domain-containing protein n=1 Tax=Geodermatophilus sp. DSM 44513 TaxID=1528104 RepID=UPI00126E3A4E|nr:alpha/beta hydrolase domain-containing protein [Geodermatophilus sp. DSM 44513]WNV77003.1 alpha/beta hydrolase domain-containing protein [Geodermatophilus sp. DSM 44513]